MLQRLDPLFVNGRGIDGRGGGILAVAGGELQPFEPVHRLVNENENDRIYIIITSTSTTRLLIILSVEIIND